MSISSKRIQLKLMLCNFTALLQILVEENLTKYCPLKKAET